MALRFPLPPPHRNMSKEEMFALMEGWQRLLTRWFYNIYDLGSNLTVDSSNRLSADTQGVTDHGALTGLTDDDHTQYMLKTLLASTVAGEGSALTGFADPNSETIYSDLQTLIASLLTWAIANGYAETSSGNGTLDFNDVDNSAWLGAVG